MQENVQRQIDDGLGRLSGKILELGDLVEEAIAGSIKALVERDSEVARRVIRGDNLIDALENEVDELCIELLALQQPLARDLRYIATAMKINTDLERIGDHAANVCERVIELNAEPRLQTLLEVPLMAQRAQSMVHKTLEALLRRDAGAARSVIAMDDALDALMVRNFRDVLSFTMKNPDSLSSTLRLSFIAKYFERIGDQATNICELIVYMAEAEVIKHPDAGEGP